MVPVACIVLLLLASYGASASGEINIQFPLNTQFSPHRLGQDEPDLGVKHELAADTMFDVAVKLKMLLQEINGGRDRTFLLSPLSIVAALGQILLAAHGGTRTLLEHLLTTSKEREGGKKHTTVELHRQMSTLIHTLQTDFTSQGTTEYILQIASAIFIGNDLKLETKFSDAVRDFYDTAILPVDFRGNPVQALNTINEWADRNTGGLVKTVLSSPLPPSAASVLLNAIYFRGSWETPFSTEVTYKDKFHTAPGEHVMVDLMRGQFQLPFVNSTQFKCSMVIIPYKYGRYAMYVILPHRIPGVTMQSFTNTLSSDVVDKIINSTKTRDVTLALPKMSITQRFSLRQPLMHFQKKWDNMGTQRSGFGNYPEQTREGTDYKDTVPRARTDYRAQGDDTVNRYGERRTGRYTRSNMKEETERIDDYRGESEMGKVENHTILEMKNNTMLEYTPDKQNNDSVEIGHVNNFPMTNSTLEDPLLNSQTNVQGGENPAKETSNVGGVDDKGTPSIFHINEDGDIEIGNVGSGMQGNAGNVNPVPSSQEYEVKNPGANCSQDTELSDRIKGDGDKLDFDLSGASTDPRFRIDDIVHQVVLEVTETGTEAAAVTSAFIDYSLSSKSFIVNRPFIFFIRHESTKATLFWGSILNPIDDILQDI